MNKPLLLVFVLFGLVIVFYFGFYSAGEVNCQSIHWHPKLKVSVEGVEQTIPIGIGINVGNVIDAELSGMKMAPTHTHESDGTIHMENQCPQKKPETFTLGYFFKVWGKSFNTTCILDYCSNGSKRVKLTVNGIENAEFGNYKMHDGDVIVISYG